VARIVSGYVKKNHVPPDDMPALIAVVYQSLTAAGKAPEPPAQNPAVPIRRSVTTNYVVCLECGRHGRMLRRHIHDRYGISAEQYRARWKLSPEHPLTAPAYSEWRSELAKRMGLGKERHAKEEGDSRPKLRHDPQPGQLPRPTTSKDWDNPVFRRALQRIASAIMAAISPNVPSQHTIEISRSVFTLISTVPTLTIRADNFRSNSALHGLIQI
jgi:predicted transcriptional regulator